MKEKIKLLAKLLSENKISLEVFNQLLDLEIEDKPDLDFIQKIEKNKRFIQPMEIKPFNPYRGSDVFPDWTVRPYEIWYGIKP